MALVRKAVVLAKKEVTYGLDPVPVAATNAILIYDPRLSIDGLVLNRATLDASLSRRPHVIGRKIVTFEFSCEIKGSGTLGTPPEISPLLQACQMGETVTPATKVSYQFIDSLFPSVTLYWYNDELLHKVTGCFGTWEMMCPAGEFGRFNFRFQGLWNDVTTAALPVGAVYQSTKPPMLTNAALTVSGYVGQIANFALQAGITVEESRDINALTDGLGKLVTNNREVTGSINPRVVATATYDPWAAWKAGTEAAMTGSFGTVAANRVKVQSAPKMQFTTANYGERAGERTFELGFGLNRNLDAGGDELVLDFD